MSRAQRGKERETRLTPGSVSLPSVVKLKKQTAIGHMREQGHVTVLHGMYSGISWWMLSEFPYPSPGDMQC